MGKVRVTIMIAALSVMLTIPTQSIAECAWVLWRQIESIDLKKASSQTYWEILGAVPNYEQCLSLQKASWKSNKSFWSESKDLKVTKIEGREPDLLFITIKDLQRTETFMCLPSPLDPRERR